MKKRKLNADEALKVFKDNLLMAFDLKRLFINENNEILFNKFDDGDFVILDNKYNLKY